MFRAPSRMLHMFFFPRGELARIAKTTDLQTLPTKVRQNSGKHNVRYVSICTIDALVYSAEMSVRISRVRITFLVARLEI